jgi:hypothetical protein
MVDSNDIDELEFLPVSSEDGEMYTDEQLEGIRKKTFTDELRSLYDKVTAGNAEAPDLPPPAADTSELIAALSFSSDGDEPSSDDTAHEVDLPRETVVRNLHDLFYKAVNLEKADTVSVGFNPFSIHNQDLYHYSIDLLKRECLKLGITQFAILCFDPRKKAYVPIVMQINSINPHNIVISPEEPLYSDILKARNGIAIDETTFSTYQYMEKRFPKIPLQGFAYAVLVQNIVMDLWADKDSAVFNELYPGNLYPIFVALVRHGTYTVDALYSSLKRSISFALYIINNHEAGRPVPQEDRTPAFLYSLIDTYGRMYSHLEGTKCFFIIHHPPFENMSYIAMTYIHSKISSLIGPNSTVLHFEKNKIILFLSLDDRDRLEKLILDAIAVFGDTISVSELERYSHLDLFKLMTCE